LALYIVSYHQSKDCAYGNQFEVYWDAPPLIGLVIGATLPRRVWVKILCALGVAIAAFVIAIFVLLQGDFAGQCGDF
jgi:hypothetical protein